MGWNEEFGAGWAPPREISELEGVEDMSWHNDTMPSFGKEVGPNGALVRLWSDHPDRDLRESDSELRYSVTFDGEAHELSKLLDHGANVDCDGWPVYETNDPKDAVYHFVKTLGIAGLALGPTAGVSGREGGGGQEA